MASLGKVASFSTIIISKRGDMNKSCHYFMFCHSLSPESLIIHLKLDLDKSVIIPLSKGHMETVHVSHEIMKEVEFPFLQ